MDQLSEAQIADLKIIFDSYDTDKNGEITHEELKQAFRRMSLPMSDLHIASIIAKLDTTNTNTIDFQEFCARNAEVASEQIFKKYDTNQDGYLTPNEVCEMAKDLGYGSISLEHAKWLIKAVDSNDDGKISFEEFKSLTITL